MLNSVSMQPPQPRAHSTMSRGLFPSLASLASLGSSSRLLIWLDRVDFFLEWFGSEAPLLFLYCFPTATSSWLASSGMTCRRFDLVQPSLGHDSNLDIDRWSEQAKDIKDKQKWSARCRERSMSLDVDSQAAPTPELPRSRRSNPLKNREGRYC